MNRKTVINTEQRIPAHQVVIDGETYNLYGLSNIQVQEISGSINDLNNLEEEKDPKKITDTVINLARKIICEFNNVPEEIFNNIFDVQISMEVLNNILDSSVGIDSKKNVITN